ncbi:MAG TPA: hypothetical protein VIK47_02270 [Kiloniellales bacterium]
MTFGRVPWRWRRKSTRPSAATRVPVSPIVLASALERLIAHLAVKRQYPLSVRRYSRRVPY